MSELTRLICAKIYLLVASWSTHAVAGISFGEAMKLIPLTQGKFAKVDDNWYDYLMKWRWCYTNGYAVRAKSWKLNIGKGMISMHNVILPPPAGFLTDHKDTDKLNNQSENLRHATHTQNGYNRKKDYDNKSGYKGVVKVEPSRKWRNPGDRWRASIKVNGKTFSLGCHYSPEDAARAYDEAAKKHFGEFAKTNF